MAKKQTEPMQALDPEGDLHQLIRVAWQLGRIDALQAANQEGDLKKPLAGIFVRQLEGQEAYLDRLVDEIVQRLQPQSLFMLEDIMDDVRRYMRQKGQ